MKILITLNWTEHFVELTPAELDTVNKVLSRLRSVKDQGTADGTPVYELAKNQLDFRIRVMPEGTQVNNPNEE